MDEFDFTHDGRSYRISRDLVIRAMRNQTPGRIQTYAVDIEGVRFPVKQVLSQTLQLPLTSFVSTRAQAILAKLGFTVINVETDGEDSTLVGTAAERERALALAVQLHAGRPASDDLAVLATAEAFLGWIGG
jgi:hypothetical protein